MEKKIKQEKGGDGNVFLTPIKKLKAPKNHKKKQSQKKPRSHSELEPDFNWTCDEPAFRVLSCFSGRWA